MTRTPWTATLAALSLTATGLAVLAGCAQPGPVAEDPATARQRDAQLQQMLAASFRSQGIASVDRLQQDPGQRACSAATPPDAATLAALQAAAQATITPPADGRYLGDWREGEKLAQSGRGMTWTDASAAAASNGGSCYNCHQIGPAELSHGTIGPSLLGYGRLRGVTDPASPQARPVVEYTWGKLANSWAAQACSLMPRFGHQGLLDEAQRKHLMALLLDPRSPVNAAVGDGAAAGR